MSSDLSVCGVRAASFSAADIASLGSSIKKLTSNMESAPFITLYNIICVETREYSLRSFALLLIMDRPNYRNYQNKRLNVGNHANQMAIRLTDGANVNQGLSI